MKQKSRKLLTRIGAALMLGLSLFNFGAAWSKFKGGALPKRARNIRKRTQEQVDSEIQQVATIAEEETQTVLAAEQLKEEEQQQQLQEETLTMFQKAVRYVAVTVWAISAGLVFTSVIFNYPFAMGKGFLSLLPGEPHVVSVSLATQNDYFQIGDKIQVDAKLSTDGEAIKQIKLTVEFDPDQLQFESYNVNDQLFDEFYEQKIDQEHGRIALSFANSQTSIIAHNEVIGSLFFKGLEKTSQCNVGIVQEESIVIKQKKGEAHNVLGKVSSAQFRILGERTPTVVCSRVEIGEGDDSWELLAQGTILPKKTTYWTEIGDEWAFRCGYNNDNELYLLISGSKQELASLNFELENKPESNVFLNIEKKWQQDEQFFFGSVVRDVEVTEGTITSVQGVKLRVNTNNRSLRWPQRDSAVFVLEK